MNFDWNKLAEDPFVVGYCNDDFMLNVETYCFR